MSYPLMETIVIVSVARMGVKYLKNINSEMVSDYASSILLLVMILTFDHLMETVYLDII